MLNYFQKYRSHIVVGVSLLLYYSSLELAKSDTTFHYRWVTFWLHIIAITVILALYLRESINKENIKKFANKNDIYLFLISLSLVAIISTLFLQIYPFPSVGDESRDGGEYARGIADGTIKNIFGYDPLYGSYGLIIQTIGSFFYNIFGNSVLTYRFPSAILAIFDVALLYVLVRLLINRTSAFFSALVLTTLPLHLFFARTQIVVAFNMFWSSALLLPTFLLLRWHRKIDYILLGTILGFAAGFHAAIRVMAILLLLAIVAMDSWKIISKHVKKEKIMDAWIKLFLLVVFCVVGFGPRILFTNETNFFHTIRLSIPQINENSTASEQKKIGTIKQNYLKSLMVWVYEPTQFFYPDHKPIFSPFMAIFFLLGVGYSFFILKKTFLYVLMYLSLAIPFLSSAITDWVNADHRISPLLSIGVIFVGIGIYYVFSRISQPKYKIILGTIVILSLVVQLSSFFNDQPAVANRDIKDYLSMHIVYFLQQHKEYHKGNVCLVVSPNNYKNLELLHYKYQYIYFTPDISVRNESVDGIGENEAYILKGECPGDYKTALRESVTACNTIKNSFYCPLDFNGAIRLHY